MKYIFGSIMALLVVFVGLWWHQTYLKDALMMRDQVEAEINQLVSNEFVFPTLHAVMEHEPTATGDEYWLNRDYAGTMRRVHIRRGIVGRDGKSKLDITIIDGRRSIIHSNFYFDKRRFALNELPPMVHDSMYRKFGVVLGKIMPDALNPEGGFRMTKRYKPRWNSKIVEVNYVGEAGGRFPKTTFTLSQPFFTILLGLLPEIIFGFILLGATGFAFYSAYRNITSQQQQLQAKDVLVANVAHELKTPIATVGVALEALNMFGADQDPTRRQEYLAIGQAELNRLDAMADRAIDSMQDGDLATRLRPATTDLSKSIPDAWRGLALRYQLPGDALQLHTDGDTIAPVDAHYWYHLVYNLLDNACKYGGRPLAIDVNLSRRAEEIVMTVTDNGPGIPGSERENIFDRFYRIYRPEEGHKVKGHGLGLSFVRQIARAHGGSIEVGNGGATGARFTVRLPT